MAHAAVVTGGANNVLEVFRQLCDAGFSVRARHLRQEYRKVIHPKQASFEHLKRPGASLLAITAPEAVRPLHFQAHVCAAKAGVNMLIKVLALEWGPAGVRVNGLSPGPIEGSWGMKNVASPSQDIVDRITKALPLRRWGKEEDIADSALFLASDAASYVTGTILETDGGATIASPESDKVDAIIDPSSDSRVGRRKHSDE